MLVTSVFFIREAHRIEEFENLQLDYLRLQEEPEAMKKQIASLHKQMTLLKKDNSIAELRIEELENEVDRSYSSVYKSYLFFINTNFFVRCVLILKLLFLLFRKSK